MLFFVHSATVVFTSQNEEEWRWEMTIMSLYAPQVIRRITGSRGI
jgi:hypothetical protein